MYTLHAGDDPGPRGTLVHQHLVIVVHISGPGASLQGKLGRRTFKCPDPVLGAIVVDTDDVSDGLVGGTLVVEVAVVVVGPVLAPHTGQAAEQKCYKSTHSPAQTGLLSPVGDCCSYHIEYNR